jgi:superfamily II DNA or RNA helicase
MIKSSYNSDEDDLITDFFESVLSETKVYKRVAAYFSSSSFKVLSKGLSHLLWSEGNMSLLVAELINEGDFAAIRDGVSNPEKIVESLFLDKEEELLELMKNANVKALGYLLATNRLSIKFVLTSKPQRIFHLKFGIFYDELGNKISFSGSINETLSAYEANIEEFKVFRGWVEGENKYIESDEQRFNSLFEGEVRNQDYYVADLPKEVRKILTGAVDKKETHVQHQSSESVKLRNYQNSAIEAWEKAKYKGIVQMATGTGKTVVALKCMDQLLKNSSVDKVMFVIGAPTLSLLTQWKSNLQRYFASGNILSTGLGRNELYDRIKRFERSDDNYMILLGTYLSLNKPWLINELLEPVKEKVALIADEVHWIGSQELRKAMRDEYPFRLGLTATPMRHFDEEGTEQLLQYFNGIVYKYTIKRAIEEGYLTPYDYHLFEARLSKDELRKYAKMTRSVLGTPRGGREEAKLTEDKINVLLSQRARIIKKAKDKLRAINAILRDLQERDKLKNLIIYFEDNTQIEEFMEEIFPLYSDKIFRVISGDDEDAARIKLIENFSNGSIDCIVGMRLLDEGIDIPSAERAIFVSSSTNPKQFIQRRGRILRLNKGKPKAEIYDIFVLVDHSGLKDDLAIRIEKNIANKELKRICTFGTNATNKSEFLSEIGLLGDKLGINVWEIIEEVEHAE